MSPTSSSATAPALPSPSAGDSPNVLAAALAVLAEGTLRFDADTRPVEPVEKLPHATSHGQVSFREPIQFRALSDGMGTVVPPSEVIFDDGRILTRGRDTSYLPADTWVEFDLAGSSDVGMRALFLRQYGDLLFILAPGLGATGAVPAGTDTVRGETANRFVVQVDLEEARARLPEHLIDLFDARLDMSRAATVPTTFEVEVWISAGRIVRMRSVHEVASTDVEALVVTYELHDFGAPMDLETPDGAEVLTVEEAQSRYLESVATPSPPG